MKSERQIYCNQVMGYVTIVHDEGLGLSYCGQGCQEVNCPHRFRMDNHNRKKMTPKGKIISITAGLTALGLLIYFLFFWHAAPRSDGDLLADLRSESETTRLYSAIELADRQNKAAFEPLQEILNSTHRDYRLKAAGALGKLEDERVVPALCRLMLDVDIYVVESTAEVLAKIGDRAAADCLIVHLIMRSPAERHWLAEAFCQVRDERSIPYLLEALVQEYSISKYPDDLLKAIYYQGADPIPSLVESVLNGGPGARELADIEKKTGQRIEAMHNVIENKDLKTLARIYLFFIYLDQDSSNASDNDRVTIEDQQVLVDALFAYGDKSMAQSFANFRLNKWNIAENLLPEAANTWAEQHGYELIITTR